MFRKKNIKLFLMCLFIIILKVGWEKIDGDPVQKVECEIVNVIDGDTLSVLYNEELLKVRLIGVDAPESVHADERKNNEYGDLASDYTKSVLEDLQYVYLEFDVEKYDAYGRLLAYVWMKKGETAFRKSLNYLLVSEGYAINQEYMPNIKHSYELKKACIEARKKSEGLWIYDSFEELWN